MLISQNDEPTFLLLPSKMTWLCVVFVLRKIWKGQNNYGELSRKEWLKFSMIPLPTVASMLLMFFCNSAEAKVQTAYLFWSVGLIFINILVMELVQEGGKLIFSVRNPVAEKVQVTEGTGLSNVEAVADKYKGDFAVSCDEEKFQAVVML